MIKQPTFTVFIREDDNTGTTFITSVATTSIEEAKRLALLECAEARGYTEEGDTGIEYLHVLGVAAGDVEILEWDDGL